MQSTRTQIALIAALSALLALPAAFAQDAKPKAAAVKGDAAPKGKDLFSPAQFDLMLKQAQAQGQQDTPELRAVVRERLNTIELVVREAKKKGMDKDPAMKAQMDLQAENVLAQAFIGDYQKAHPIPDAVLRKEYDGIKAQMGDKEYKVRHILVEKEDDAKDVIVQLQKGEKFEKLAADRSKDTGSKANGGDLDWNAPANFVKPFSDAMIATPKGKFTATPVQTQFGWHVIMVEDIRDAKVPSFEEVKPQLAQRAQNQAVDQYLKELRAKNGY
jgi:peptidyl-prolyl cis-trans isomerase C